MDAVTTRRTSRRTRARAAHQGPRRALLPPLPRARRAVAGAVLATALLSSVAGCRNPFKPARPEPPIFGGVIEHFETPDRVLETIAEAIRDKGTTNGLTAYVNALAESTSSTTRDFVAFHYPAVVDRWEQGSHQLAPNPWDRQLESRFYSFLPTVRESDDYFVEFLPDSFSSSDDIDNVAGTALLHRRYVLTATSPDGATEEIIAIGFADLFFYKSTSRWYIYRWQDRIDPRIGVAPTAVDWLTMGARRLESQSQ